MTGSVGSTQVQYIWDGSKQRGPPAGRPMSTDTTGSMWLSVTIHIFIRTVYPSQSEDQTRKPQFQNYTHGYHAHSNVEQST